MSNLFIILEYEFTDESPTERSGSLRHRSPSGDVEGFQDMVQNFQLCIWEDRDDEFVKDNMSLKLLGFAL